MSTKEQTFAIGDEVQVTLEGMQKYARSTPAYMGYTPETINWLQRLSGFLAREEAGTILVVSCSGDHLTVHWPSCDHAIGVPSYMVDRV